MAKTSKASSRAWSKYSDVKKEAQKEYAKGNMTPKAYTAKVTPALDKALNTPI